MRIEINSGGLGALTAVAGYQANMVSFVNKAEDVISSFKTVRKQTKNLSGGVGRLQSALDDVNARIQKEEMKVEAVVDVYQKTNQFLELAKRVDKQVAAAVDCNRDQFYKSYPHLKPAGYDNESKSWLEKAGEWLFGKVKDYVEWRVDIIRKTVTSIVDFCKTHKYEIMTYVAKVAAAIGIVAAGLAFGPAGAIIAGVVFGAMVGFIEGGIEQLKSDQPVCWSKIAIKSLTSAIKYGTLASGNVVASVIGGFVSKFIDGTADALTAEDGSLDLSLVQSLAWQDVGKIAVDSLVSGAVNGVATYFGNFFNEQGLTQGLKVAVNSLLAVRLGIFERAISNATGIVKDGKIETKEVIDYFKDTYDPNEIVTDATTGAIEATA